jgi:hypothetical protein
VLALVSALGLALTAPAGAVGSATTTAYPIPTVVAVRAATHPGYDRYVLQFDRATPPAASVAWVSQVIGDFSGLPVPVPGRAFLRLVVQGQGFNPYTGRATFPHDLAFALPALVATRGAGDFEGVLTLGIGVAKKTWVRLTRLSNPGRIVVDVGNSVPWTWRGIAFLDKKRFAVGTEPYERYVIRPVRTDMPVTSSLDRLFAGPTAAERNANLVFVASEATGFKVLSVSGQIARIQLTGGCNSGGSTYTIAGEIAKTLKPLSTVTWIKIYDPAGRTEQPTGNRDSIPECLEP